MARDNSSFHVLLGILGEGPCSGYDIKKKVESEIGHYYKISNGQIYPTLKRLTESGHATQETENSPGKPGRKVYSITDMGRAVFREWLDRPVDYQNPGGNELLLKLHFGAQADIGRCFQLLARHREKNDKMYSTYLEIEKQFYSGKIDGLSEHYSYLTLLHGLMITKASVDWCDKATDILKSHKQ